MPSAPNPAPTEIELKFILAPESLQRLRKNPLFRRGAHRVNLNTVYYDTPGCDLREGGMSLRVREADGRFVQTVKSRKGAALFDRNEWEFDIKDGRPQSDYGPLGALLDDEGRAGLSAIFTTKVERTVRDCKVDGAVVELSLDEGEIFAGGRSEPICELELELKKGNPSALFDLARDLGADGPLRLSFESKSERGYRLAGRDGMKALKAERTLISPKTPAGDAFRRIVRSCLMQITGNAERLSVVRSPDALHQLRVGLRRLRAALGIFKSVVGDSQFDHMKAETKWLATSLNEARDLDVFLRSIAPGNDDAPDEDESLAAFRQALIRRQATAYDVGLAAIGSHRLDVLLLDLAAWAEAGEWATTDDPVFKGPREEAASKLAARTLDRLRRSVVKKGRKLKSLDARGRHKVRIRIKKLRYAADFLGSAVQDPKRSRRQAFSERLRALQDSFGELNDIAVARDLAHRVIEAPGGAGAGYAAGQIIAEREARERELLRASVEGFTRFSKAKAFW